MKKRFLNLMALALVVTATLVSCKGKEGAADETATDSTTVVTDSVAPAPEAPAATTDSAATPADSAAAPAK